VCSSGPIVSTGLYAGEHYDARRERTGWSSAGFDASGWALVEVTGYDASLLVAPQGPPIRAVEVLAPKRVERAPSGRLIVDFGQNISGRLRIRVQAPAGHTITFRHAEVLEDGELSLRPLRQAKALDQYVAADAAWRNGSRGSPCTGFAMRSSKDGRATWEEVPSKQSSAIPTCGERVGSSVPTRY